MAWEIISHLVTMALKKEFHETIWYDIKDMFLNSLKESKSKGFLSISLGQTVIKLLKKEREKKKQR